jgi:mRNA interferase MazF
MGAAADEAHRAAKKMKQYEIFWANLPEPIGRRPVLLLTRTSAYAYLNKVIVVEITSTVRGIPQEVLLGKEEGFRQPSVANMDNIHVAPKSLLGDRIGRLEAGREAEIKRALGYALDWLKLKMI